MEELMRGDMRVVLDTEARAPEVCEVSSELVMVVKSGSVAVIPS